ncbi:MAG TPA: TonB-dependent receptor plug domain-containing protein, partial [Crocinitomicaceae bacterium]|nr:TonB-dependent receptor plug domain-containing protein [Crocinitomicaceae bacterium]
MKKTGVFLATFAYLFAFGQEQPLDTLLVSTKRKTNTLTTITAKDIERLQAHDLGEVLQKLPGLTVKNFGGVGGMKTVSVRGLGSAQQQIVLDGFLIP